MLDNGLNELYDAGEKAKVDIVFIHGLRGHPRKTWEVLDPGDPDELVYWPKELLPIDIPESRIFSFGYPTDFATFYPIATPDLIAHSSIDDHSTSIITSLGSRRQETGTEDRPVVFVCHSLGGLVCANSLSRQHGLEPIAKKVVEQTRGAIFLGTPFQGTSKATWVKIAGQFLGLFSDSSDQTIKDLDKNSAKLKQISSDFQVLLRMRNGSSEQSPIQVVAFFETRTTTIKKLGIRKDIGLVVTKESASLAGYNPVPINEDHRTMCRFPHKQTSGYIAVAGALKTIISNMDKASEHLQRGHGISIQGDVNNSGGVNFGIQTGHNVGLTKDANRLEVSHTFNSNGSAPGAAMQDAVTLRREALQDR